MTRRETVGGGVLRLAGMLGVLIAMVAAPPMRAQSTAVAPQGVVAESTLDARTKEVASQLRCPVCQGMSIQDSPSELAQQMRELARQQLAAGKSPAEVKAYFVGRYGEWILMTPEAHGFNWFVYVAPLLVLAGGAWVLFGALRRWTGRAGSPPPTGPGAGHDTPSGETRTLL